jgi:hypothetical protein
MVFRTGLGGFGWREQVYFLHIPAHLRYIREVPPGGARGGVYKVWVCRLELQKGMGSSIDRILAVASNWTRSVAETMTWVVCIGP